MFLKEIQFHQYLVDSYHAAATPAEAGNVLVSLFHAVQDGPSSVNKMTPRQFDEQISSYFGSCERFGQAREVLRSRLDL